MPELWVEKYRPRTIKEVVAPRDIIEKVVMWAKKWEEGIPQKPLLLAGPPGVGKTSLALALANTFGWEVVELNASDQRNWQVIRKIVGEAAFTETISEEGEFFSSKSGRLKLIILDEVDNIHKKEDFGGEGALIRLLKRQPRQPLILTANDPYNLSPELRNFCEMITFKRLDVRQIVKVLERICAAEGIKADKRALEAIARNAGGDLRAAINDLQAIAEGKTEIKFEDVIVAKRTQETDVFKVMQKIFKTYNPAVYGEAMLLDESPEDLVIWIDENLPLEYEGEDLLKAYLVLSRADMFLGRVRRRQFYRLWRYASYLMTVGVQQVKSKAKGGWTRYQKPNVWQLLIQFKDRREKFRKILEKIAKYSHMSKKKASAEMFGYIKVLLSKADIKTAASVAAFYDFTEEELTLIIGNERRAKEIKEFIRKHKLHRVEEEAIEEEISVEKIEKEIEERLKRAEEEKPKEKKVEKKKKRTAKKKKKEEKPSGVTTLEDFFG